jgi:hypothetical protein
VVNEGEIQGELTTESAGFPEINCLGKNQFSSRGKAVSHTQIVD